MTLNCSFEELVTIIKEKTGKQLLLKYVSNDTVRVGYELQVKMPFLGTKSKAISLDVTLDEIKGSDLNLHYSTQTPVGDVLMSGLTSFIPSIHESDVVEVSGTSVIVHLDKVDKLKDTISKVTLNRICFDESAANLDFTLNHY